MIKRWLRKSRLPVQAADGQTDIHFDLQRSFANNNFLYFLVLLRKYYCCDFNLLVNIWEAINTNYEIYKTVIKAKL